MTVTLLWLYLVPKISWEHNCRLLSALRLLKREERLSEYEEDEEDEDEDEEKKFIHSAKMCKRRGGGGGLDVFLDALPLLSLKMVRRSAGCQKNGFATSSRKFV